MWQFLKPNTAEVSAKLVDGEAILINLSNGMYYSMDSVGGFIWSLIEQGHDLDSISATVARRYAADEDVAKRDVEALAQQLLDENLIVPAEAGVSKWVAETNHVTTPQAYSAPLLNKFDDMTDLFALDPPLPELSKLKPGGGEGA